MKKKVFLPLLVVLMLIVASLPLFAAEDPTIYLVSNATGAVQAGETFTVDIMMKNNPGVFMINVQLADYSDNFEIQDITVGSLMQAGASNINKELGRILFEAADNADVTENGKLATVTFKVKSGVTNANHAISINVLSANNFNVERVTFATEGATVSTKCVHTYTYADSSDTQHTCTCTKCGYVTQANHTYGVGVIKAGDDSTCTATGFTTYTCKDCSHEDRKNDVAMKPHSYGAWTKVDDNTHNRTCPVCSASDTPVAHSWNDGVITTDPTHTETGVKTYTCSDCLAQKTSSVPVNPEHTWGSWEKYSAEQHKHICSVGGETEYGDHVWNAGVVTKKATCKEEGIMLYTCTECNETKTVSIDKLTEHTWGKYTYKDMQTHTRTCAVCGEVKEEAHNQDRRVKKDPTCTEDGSYTYYCTDCNSKVGSSKIRAKGHVFGDWTVESEATATSDRVEKRVCLVCGEAETRTSKCEHAETKKETKAATCTEDGYVKDVCTACGFAVNTEVVKATGHNPGEWEVSKEATYDEEGLKVKKCTVCGEVLESEKIPVVEKETTTTTTETTTTATTEAPEPEKKSNTALIVILSVIGVAAVATVAALLIKKKKAK